MVKARKERRWARVATAVALCLPCSSFVIPLHAADIAQAKKPWRHCRRCAQSQLNRESAACAADGVAQCSIAAFAARHAYPVAIRQYAKGDANAIHCAPRTLRLCTDSREFAPRPSKPGGKPGCAGRKTQTSSRPSPSITNRPGVRRVRRRRCASSHQRHVAGLPCRQSGFACFLRSMVARQRRYGRNYEAASAREVMASDYMVDR